MKEESEAERSMMSEVNVGLFSFIYLTIRLCCFSGFNLVCFRWLSLVGAAVSAAVSVYSNCCF